MALKKQSLLIRAGVLVVAVGSMMVLPACSDTPEGAPARGSLSIPRTGGATGEAGAAVDPKADEKAAEK